MVDPDSPAKTNAVEVSEDILLSDNSLISSDRILMDNGNSDESVMLSAANPSVGLAVSNNNREIGTVQGGSTAYSDHVVTITGEEVINYTLSMSSSSSNLAKPSGTSGKDITGAGGVSGNSMEVNKWGYAVTEESTTNFGGLTYNTVPTSSTTIASGNATSSNTLNTKKKIVFAARFGEDAAPGNYKHGITLSVVANASAVAYKITYNSNGGGTAPAASIQESAENSVTFTLPGQEAMSKSGYGFVGWSTSSSATSGTAAGSSYTVNRNSPQITLYAVWKVPVWGGGITSGSNMQSISSGFCKNNNNVPVGSTINLKDSRDGNTYVIYKAADGNCWMGENLRLNGGILLTPSDSDVDSNWTLPASSDSSWKTDYNSAQMRDGKSGMRVSRTRPGDGGGWRFGFGNYYSWPAATAETATTSITDADAPSSICPKGWKLPANSGDGSFQNLVNAYQGDWLTGLAVNGTANMVGRYLGYSGTSLGKGANFWPAAGYAVDEGIEYPGQYGYYWSRRAATDYLEAYFLNFGLDDINPQNAYYRYIGRPVRCVAQY